MDTKINGTASVENCENGLVSTKTEEYVFVNVSNNQNNSKGLGKFKEIQKSDYSEKLSEKRENSVSCSSSTMTLEDERKTSPRSMESKKEPNNSDTNKLAEEKAESLVNSANSVTQVPSGSCTQEDNKITKPTNSSESQEAVDILSTKNKDNISEDKNNNVQNLSGNVKMGFSRQKTSILEVSPAVDKGFAISSPPDFFVSRVIHDGKCFVPKHAHCVAVCNNTAYIYGGFNSENKICSDMISFTPETNTFVLVQSNGLNPGCLANATMVPVRHKNGELALFLFGGENSAKKEQALSWIFDLNDCSWIRGPNQVSSLTPRKGHCCVVSDATNAVYIWGGYCSNNVLNDGYKLDGTKWSKLRELTTCHPSGRCYHSAILFNDEEKDQEYIYIFGGDLSGRGAASNELWVYDVKEECWSLLDDAVGEPPSPRFNHSATLHDNRMWIIGGQYGGWFSNYTISDFHVYDLKMNCWFLINLASKEFGYHADFGNSCFIPACNAFYVFGGVNYEGIPVSDVCYLTAMCTTESIANVQSTIIECQAQVKSMLQNNGRAEQLFAKLLDCDVNHIINKLQQTEISIRNMHAEIERTNEVATVAKDEVQKANGEIKHAKEQVQLAKKEVETIQAEINKIKNEAKEKAECMAKQIEELEQRVQKILMTQEETIKNHNDILNALERLDSSTKSLETPTELTSTSSKALAETENKQNQNRKKSDIGMKRISSNKKI